MDYKDDTPRMAACPHCNAYNCTNDPSIPDLVAGEHTCRHCRQTFPMAQTFRHNEAYKIEDRMAALEKAVQRLEATIGNLRAAAFKD